MMYLTLHDSKVPLLGFGTFRIGGESALRVVAQALEVGYRHIDTAQMYGNEAEIGQVVRRASIPRAEIFITTKVWPNHFARARLSPPVDESLARLNTDYVDLLLLHWPNPQVPLSETLDALMAVQRAGKARLIGVSNFTPALMRKAYHFCGAGVLTNNQIEYHPYLKQDAVIEAAHELDMLITAYQPLAKGRVARDKNLQHIGAKYGKTAAQVTLRWLIQQGIAAIPSSQNPRHIEEDFAVFDFALDPEDIAAINALHS